MPPVRPTLRRAAAALRERLSPLQIVACALLLFALDAAYRGSGNAFFPAGVLDVVAHFLTALLLLQVVPPRRRAGITGPALVAAVAIDLDHIPQDLGYHFLTVGTPRPYTHSLLTLAVLLGAALIVRRRRLLLAGLALGVALHFLRDLAEGNGSGVALLWPLSDHAFSYPHGAYVALMAAVTVLDICLVALSRRSPVAAPQPAHRRAA